ncbi:MAG: Hpt domain-containing protein [Candidatus Acidiferrum sp.]|jgi:HPt (histidine-containing phosphotransfer) domain-containing protein
MQNKVEHQTQQVWNLAELLARVDNDIELLHDLLGIFKEDFPRLKQSLLAAVACGDLRTVGHTSHALKGMFANLGAERAAAAAAKLEELASSGERRTLQDALDCLDREATSLLPQLDAYMAEVKH